jgi:hypothetical protein
MRTVYRILVGKPEVNRPIESDRSRWKDNIKMDMDPASYPGGTGEGLYSRGVKRPGRESDHSHSDSDSEVKDAWCCISTPPYVFMVWCSVKYRLHLYGVVLR